jgi:hypothetical protein
MYETYNFIFSFIIVKLMALRENADLGCLRIMILRKTMNLRGSNRRMEKIL